MTVTEFDLDRGAPADLWPGGALSTLGRAGRSALLATALVAAAIGAGVLRTASREPAAVRPAPVAARLTVRALTLAPEPVMSVRLTVSASSAEVALDRVDLRGGGVAEGVRPLRATLRPGVSLGFDLEVAMRCQPFGDPGLTASLRVRDATAGSWRSVPVAIAGALRVDGGGCALAARLLPPGWQSPVPAEAARVEAGALVVRFGDLGAGRQIIGVLAAGVGLLHPAPTGHPGAAETALLPPTIDCARMTREPVVPAGLALVIRGGPEGVVTRYAAVGPTLSGWLQGAYARQCPSPRRAGRGR